MKHILPLLALFSTCASAAPQTVGTRVWAAIESPWVIDDSYASGVVRANTEDYALVAVRDRSDGQHRTYTGSCTGLNDLPNEASVAELIGADTLEQLPHAWLSPYADGRSRFLEREQLAVRFQRWQSRAPGLRHQTLSEAKSRALAAIGPRGRDAFALMALLQRSRAPVGFVEADSNHALNLLDEAEALGRLFTTNSVNDGDLFELVRAESLGRIAALADRTDPTTRRDLRLLWNSLNDTLTY